MDVNQIVVVKIGGSVLTSSAAYCPAAQFLAKRVHESSGERFLVIVSAERGLTDSLERAAREIRQDTTATALDLLWYTGELRSAAFLTMHLEALNIKATALNVHQTGLRTRNKGNAWQNFHHVGGQIPEALADFRVVVVPGFFAVGPGETVVSLGRGGSDLAAVLLADAFEAKDCEFVKDVPGYFTDDPHRNPNARPIKVLSYRKALGMAYAGCTLVQQEALQMAAIAELPIVIRSLDDNTTWTIISSEEGRETSKEVAVSCRTADERAIPRQENPEESASSKKPNAS